MWAIGPLTKAHDRRAFDCGEPSLDGWLKSQATPWTRKGLSRVFVATHGGSDRVLGYYTLSNHYVCYDALPEDLARGLPASIDVPAILLGRLAVDRSVSGRGVGTYLLFDAMRRATLVADQVGTTVFEVHALNGRAREFYLRNGLLPLEDDPQHLFLPIRVIRGLGLDETEADPE
jgi:GNAT superfamily N-acetyltransferase